MLSSADDRDLTFFVSFKYTACDSIKCVILNLQFIFKITHDFSNLHMYAVNNSIVNNVTTLGFKIKLSNETLRCTRNNHQHII